MQVAQSHEYTLKVTQKELRLIGLALGGRLKDFDDVTASKALNVRLLELLTISLGQELNRVEDALEWATRESEPAPRSDSPLEETPDR